MVKIKLNQVIFDRHSEEIKNSLETKITNKLKTKLWQYEKKCLNYIKMNLKDILKADDKQLIEYIEHFKNNFPKAIGNPNTKEKNWKRLYKILRKDIFEKEYDSWSQRTKYGAYSFVEGLGLKTCPYCNRNYTFIVNNDNGKLRPEIDHFYPKSIYPFLAMSFYNLIPSCPTCNHTKKARDSYKEKLINPYEFQINDFKLTYIPSTVEFNDIKNQKYNYDNFEIEFEEHNKNIEVFKLQELYSQHKDIVLELLIKKAYYPKSYIKELEGFGFNEDEIYRYLLGNYQKDEDLHKRPLSKLIKDISKELGLIK